MKNFIVKLVLKETKEGLFLGLEGEENFVGFLLIDNLIYITDNKYRMVKDENLKRIFIFLLKQELNKLKPFTTYLDFNLKEKQLDNLIKQEEEK